MITELILGIQGYPAGTPVEFIEFTPAFNSPKGRTEMVAIRLPDGREIEVDAGRVSSGIHHPEETLGVLAQQTGIREDTLLKAAQQGRLLARRSGATWLSTVPAIEWAQASGKIRADEFFKKT